MNYYCSELFDSFQVFVLTLFRFGFGLVLIEGRQTHRQDNRYNWD
jgi:hypothetical protein